MGERTRRAKLVHIGDGNAPADGLTRAWWWCEEYGGQVPAAKAAGSWFDVLERRLLADWSKVGEPAHRQLARAKWDEFASMIEEHEIAYVLHRQPCEVTSRHAAFGA